VFPATEAREAGDLAARYLNCARSVGSIVDPNGVEAHRPEPVRFAREALSCPTLGECVTFLIQHADALEKSIRDLTGKFTDVGSDQEWTAEMNVRLISGSRLSAHVKLEILSNRRRWEADFEDERMLFSIDVSYAEPVSQDFVFTDADLVPRSVSISEPVLVSVGRLFEKQMA